jgi:glycosyltransferase involved in cell wall biosynthesis
MFESTLMTLHFHLLSFEGPDPYAMAGGIGTRVSGLAEALAHQDIQTHLWFVGDPWLPGHEDDGTLHLHRWCQWLSRHHRAGVYDGEVAKAEDYSRSLPPALASELLRATARGDSCVVLAEEWHTVGAVLGLDALLRRHKIRDQVSILWNANNTFGFDDIDWKQLSSAAQITTVSRYMKHMMKPLGVDPMVIPNGLSPDAFGAIDESSAGSLRSACEGRTLLTKVARWDPDKRWLAAIEIVASLKREGARPVLIARGGLEAHGAEVLAAAGGLGLRVANVEIEDAGGQGLLDAFDEIDGTDIINVRSHLDWETRRLLYRESAAVLANSGHEPFGLVGLETMAGGGVACTGCSGEDYAVPGHNALVLESASADEFMALFGQIRDAPEDELSLRDAGMATAKHYAWPGVIRRALVPRVQLGRAVRGQEANASSML